MIVLDTPGGLSESMRKIVQKELAVSKAVPVIVYVAPDGARAASAGVWISEAADVLAMAPNTNIGSSTPINSTAGTSAATCGARSSTTRPPRCAASRRATAATRSGPTRPCAVAKNLTADEALKQNVIDVIAPTLPALLTQDRRHDDRSRST